MHSSGYEFNNERLFLRFNGLMFNIIEKSKGMKATKEIQNKMNLIKHYHDEFLFRSYYAYSILKRMRLLNTIRSLIRF